MYMGRVTLRSNVSIMHKAMKTQSEAAGYTGAFFNLETDGGN